MSKIYKGTLDLIGNTPLVEVVNLEKSENLEAALLVKLEYFNPAGSVKDRIAKAMIEDAESKGLLTEGSVIIDKIKRSRKVGYGFDAYNETYVDMLEAGIVDPTKVTRSALQNAASVAAMVLTTESLVADKKEENPAPVAANPGIGGMY